MNKKGATSVASTLVGIAILIVLAAVILLYIIGPEAILPSVANAADKIADKTLSGLRKEKIEKNVVESSSVNFENYENILSALRGTGNGPCLLSYTSLSSDFKGLKITLSESDQGIFVRLTDKKDQIVGGKTNTISGKKPCVVGEGNAAQNFYDNYLKDKQCESNCLNDYSTATIEFSAGGTIYVNGQERNLKDGNFLFKAKDGNICFFPTVNKWFKDCHAEKEGLDDDCMKLLVNMKKCDETTYNPVFFGGNFYGKKSDWKFVDGIFYYTGQDSRVPFMFKIESKDVSLGSKGLYETEFNRIFSSKVGEIPTKTGVYYQNIYYDTKANWQYKEGTIGEAIYLCNKCWVYVGKDDGVPKEFKSKGITIEEKLRLFGP